MIARKSTIIIILVLIFTACFSCQKKSQKIWLHRANSIEKAQYFQDKYAGLEIDLTYIDSLQTFLVLHGGSLVENNPVTIEEWLDAMKDTRKIKLWLDYKNLNNGNKTSSLDELNRLCSKYKLRKKNIIVESGNATCLPDFYNAGFKTSFYIPHFIPKEISSTKIHEYTNEIRNAIKQNDITTISGYYYQYQFMRDSFPDKDILIWYHFNDSLIRNEYIRLANSDSKVKVLLVADEIPID